MLGKYKVVVNTAAGRRRYMQYLVPFILSSDIVDRYDIWINTHNGADIEFFRRIAEMYPKINLVWQPDDSHFLIVPSLGECYGLVFCEACAFGVPSISHAIGGIPTIIKNDINGFLFNLGTKACDFADKILSIWQNGDEYQNLCLKARKEYDERLNWNVAGKRLTAIIEKSI